MSEDLLTQGITAYNAGRIAEAGDLFLQLLERDPDHELAWLWLSGTVETDQDRLQCLQRVVEINPHNGIARRGLESLRKRVSEPVVAPAGAGRQTLNWQRTTAEGKADAEPPLAVSEAAAEDPAVENEADSELAPADHEADGGFVPAESEIDAEETPAEYDTNAGAAASDLTHTIYALMRQAVDAIKAGDPETGQPLLIKALNLDEDNEAAWLWMTRCVTEPDLKRECFERVLEINPENTRAIRGLKRLEAALEEEGAADAEENTTEETGEGEEGATSGEKPRLTRGTRVLMVAVTAAALVAVVLLVFMG